MTPKYLSFRKDKTVETALSEIRKKASSVEMIYHMYVTNATRQIEGTLDLKSLLTASPETLLEEIMDEPISASVYNDSVDVAKLMQDSDLVAVPIVDSDSRLVGVFTVDDAMDVLSNEAVESALAASGLVEFSSRETDRSKVLINGKTIDILRVRIPFLLVTLFGTLFAGVVIAGFEEGLAKVTALAFFIPVVMAMGGNVGSQSSTIFTRALALGQIDLKRFLRQWRKEVWIGFMMGLILGLLAFFVVWLWQGSLDLSLTIGLSLITSITLATALGYMIPYVLLKLGVDQAAGAIPFITTIQDILGLLVYFLLALLLI
jgi:magnesium transporter